MTRSSCNNGPETRFRQDGFAAIRGFLDHQQLGELHANVRRFIDKIMPIMPSEHVFLEDKNDANSLKQLQHLERYDVWFNQLISKGPLRGLAQVLLEGDVVPKNLQYFNKPPGVGRATPPHQDGFYFMLSPCLALTMWLALDEVDEQNGCVRYIRGSHRLGIRPHQRTQTLGFSQGIADFPTAHDKDHEVAVTAHPGDLLVHDAQTVHYALPNRSTRPRRALGFIYYSSDANEDTLAYEAYQKALAADLKVAGKI